MIDCPIMKRTSRIVKPTRKVQPDGEFDTEKAQALVRIIIVTLADTFVITSVVTGLTPTEGWSAVGLCSYYLPFSLAAYFWVVKRPGVNRLRRTITISHDLGALAYTIAVGGAALVPLFAIMLWVTVGNGLRFGPAYLKASTAATLGAIGVITYFNPYWHQNPAMVLTFALTTLLVPAYIYVATRPAAQSLRGCAGGKLVKVTVLGASKPRSPSTDPCNQSFHCLPARRQPAAQGIADGREHRPIAAERIAVVQVSPGYFDFGQR